MPFRSPMKHNRYTRRKSNVLHAKRKGGHRKLSSDSMGYFPVIFIVTANKIVSKLDENSALF